MWFDYMVRDDTNHDDTNHNDTNHNNTNHGDKIYDHELFLRNFDSCIKLNKKSRCFHNDF